MNIIVVMKQTFDTEEKIFIKNGEILEEDVNFIINPYDEYAVEEAIRLKEKFGGEVTLVTLGKERSETSLRTALAMGADKAILIVDSSEFKDEMVIAKILGKVIKDLSFDLVLCGNVSVDYGSAQIGPRLAEELDLAQITAITALNVDGSTLRVERDVEGDLEMIESNLPILLTVQQGLNDPRYPTLPGIMKAKKKEVRILQVSEIGLDETELVNKTRIVNCFLQNKTKETKILQGELVEQCHDLVGFLLNEVKLG